MTTTLTNGTLAITYTADATKISRVLLAAAEYLYPNYPILVLMDGVETVKPFAKLTSAQRLKVIDQHVKRVIMDCAKTHVVSTAMSTARATAESEDLSL